MPCENPAPRYLVLKVAFQCEAPFLRRKGPGKVGHSSKRVNNARVRALIA